MKRLAIIILTLFSSALASAQTACDSLEIDVKYSAFTDSLIEIRVTNNGTAFYSYPGFVIFNTNGDTVAKEEVTLFGLGSSSAHVLKVYPGMVTNSSFPGSLQLWSGFFTTQECNYNMTFDLCPDTCVNVYPFIGNMGGAMSLGTVTWTLQDSLSTVVASGSFTLDNTSQMDEDTVCLLPGTYSLHVSGIASPMAGQPYIGLSTHLPNAPEPQTPYQNAATQLSFDFYAQCPVITSLSTPENTSDILVFSHGGAVHLRSSGKPLGEITVLSITGQVVWRENVTSSRRSIDLRHLHPGIYMVTLRNQQRQENRKIFLNN